MNLHENKQAFEATLITASEFFGFKEVDIVEKDYYVTYFLQKIAQKQPGVIFKGGTSLSKCHKIINRFSEDIDLSIETKTANVTNSQRNQLKKDIVSIVDESGFSLENSDQIKSRNSFNRYVIDFNAATSSSYLNPRLIVETSVFIKSFPTKILDAASFVYDFLLAKNAEGEIYKYNLEPFKVNVQSLERTFIDKVFALGDYYLDGRIDMHSRHIYDLYKLYPKINFDNTFAELVADVRGIRKPHAACLSAQEDIDLPALLRKIISEETYKSDYTQITDTLLFEKIPYEEAVTVITRILSDGCFV